MTSPLQALTPDLYASLNPAEQRRADRFFRGWAGRTPELDPLFCAMRAYTQGQVAWMMFTGLLAWAGAIVIGLASGEVWWTVGGVVLIGVWVGIALRSWSRVRRISRYFRAQGITAASRRR